MTVVDQTLEEKPGRLVAPAERRDVHLILEEQEPHACAMFVVSWPGCFVRVYFNVYPDESNGR